MRILRNSIWRLYPECLLVQRSYAYAAYVILGAIALRLDYKYRPMYYLYAWDTSLMSGTQDTTKRQRDNAVANHHFAF